MWLSKRPQAKHQAASAEACSSRSPSGGVIDLDQEEVQTEAAQPSFPNPSEVGPNRGDLIRAAKEAILRFSLDPQRGTQIQCAGLDIDAKVELSVWCDELELETFTGGHFTQPLIVYEPSRISEPSELAPYYLAFSRDF